MRKNRTGVGTASVSRGTLLLFLLTASVVLLALSPGIGVARQGIAPKSFTAPVLDLTRVDTVILPAVDEATYLREDQEREASGVATPLRFAAPIATQMTPKTDGTWETLADGSRLWRLQVVSVGARSLNFGLTSVRLPEGATFYFYAPDRQTYDGPYEAADVTSDGQFWSAIILGDTAVLELSVPARAALEPELAVSQVGHDYRGFGQVLEKGLQQGSCNNDVICPEGLPWADDIQSAGVYTLSGSWTCSGQMVNSNQTTPPPYFLTAYHCSISAGNQASIVVYWNYESPTCGMLSGGSLAQHQSGCTLKAKYSSSDFCLVQLNADPSPAFDVYYAGWDANDTSGPATATCIHHPNCEEKMISFTTIALTVTSYLSNTVPGDGTHWRVTRWADGTTEGGSSGSGLWDPSHHIVGQLHGGYASCSSLTSDWYGRISKSWTGGGSSSNRLRDWLDPASTGTLVLDGRYPNDESSVEALGISGAAGGLRSIQPNPARGAFQVSLRLDRTAMVAMELFDAAGRAVASTPPRATTAGDSQVRLEAKTSNGASLAPGLYFVRLSVDGKAAGSQKLIVMQ